MRLSNIYYCLRALASLLLKCEKLHSNMHVERQKTSKKIKDVLHVLCTRFRQRKPTNLKIQTSVLVLPGSSYRKVNFSAGNKMAAECFTTITGEPYTAHKVQGKPHFCNICPCANDIVYARFEDVKVVCAKTYG